MTVETTSGWRRCHGGVRSDVVVEATGAVEGYVPLVYSCSTPCAQLCELNVILSLVSTPSCSQTTRYDTGKMKDYWRHIRYTAHKEGLYVCATSPPSSY